MLFAYIECHGGTFEADPETQEWWKLTEVEPLIADRSARGCGCGCHQVIVTACGPA